MIIPTSAARGLPCLAVLLLAACGAPNPPAAQTPPALPPVQPPTGADTPPPFDIAWGHCELPTWQGHLVAECATVEATARRDVEDSGTVQVAVYRFASPQQPATAQLWLLNGGPGAAGFGLAPTALEITTKLEGVDVYLLDHRGTGASEWLDCPEAGGTATSMHGFMQACSQEVRAQVGDRMDGFTTTEVAHDLRELIDSTAHASQKVYVYGVSYGSYLVHRLLQLSEARVDGVITDGNCIGTLCSLDTPHAFRVDEAVGHVTDVCRDTPACAARLGDDPWAFIRETVDLLEGGHCSDALLSAWAPGEWTATLGSYWPAGVPPTFYRLQRCNEEDVAALDVLAARLVEARGGPFLPARPLPFGPVPEPTEETAASGPLFYHVAASELIPRPAPTPAELAARAEALTFKPSPQSLDITWYDAWEVYPRDTFVGAWATREVPWLMLQGTFDFQTPWSLAEASLAYLPNPRLQLVRIDGGGHGAAFASDCGYALVGGFLANPAAPVDDSCLPDVKAASLEVPAHYAQHYFGTSSVWGSGAQPSP